MAFCNSPHIARPRIVHHGGEGIPRKPGGFLTPPGGVLQEPGREVWYVVLAFPQGRQPYGEDIQPIIEVLPEVSPLDFAPEIAIGRTDDPHVDRKGPLPPDPLEGALLERPQELHLHRFRKVRHFIEENGAAVREFKAALLVADGP